MIELENIQDSATSAAKCCVIIGASHAGTTLAFQLRKEGWLGSIKLVGAENELPYHRPPLSKDYLAGEKLLDGIRLRPEKLYTDKNIELLLGRKVEQIDAENRRVHLSDGEELAYDKLALCTGAKVRKLPLAEPYGNVFYIRQADDVAPLAVHLEAGKKAVVIGAGYIGLEAAAVMAKKGLDVTVLETEDRILKRVTGEAMSNFMAQLHRDHGVKLHTNTRVTQFVGTETEKASTEKESIERVICEDGSEFEADIVVVGIGVIPDTELAQQAGCTVEQGVLVNEQTQTSNADIFAAGDCVSFPSAIYTQVMRLESVQNANDQARVAAANICGRPLNYDSVPWFWSDQYDIKLQMVGINTGFDQLVIRGDPENQSGEGFALFYLKQGVLIAADCVARPREFMLSKQLIKDRAVINPALLADEKIAVTEFKA